MIRPIFAALLLAGCAPTTDNAPSLLPRPIETRSDAEPVATTAPAAADPALDAEIARRVAAFDAAARAFDGAVPGVEAKLAAARGAAEGSERWLDGQSAIGDLQQLRAAAEAAMAEIEELAIVRATDGRLPYPALDGAIATAQGLLERQLAAENRLKALIGG